MDGVQRAVEVEADAGSMPRRYHPRPNQAQERTQLGRRAHAVEVRYVNADELGSARTEHRRLGMTEGRRQWRLM